MNLDRLRWGEWIAAIAGLDLILVTFRAWYKLSGGGGRITAWDALHSGRYLLIAAGVVGVFFLLIRAAEDAGQLGELPLGWITALVGFAATVYVAYRLATPPSDSLDPDPGLFFGLAGAVGVAIGGLLAAREGATAAPAFAAPAGDAGAETAATEPLGALVPDSGPGWSPAPPAASTGWTSAPVPPATAAGAGMADDVTRPLRAGDHVALTAGGARFPAGTIAEVVAVFGGGALVEVKAPDGVPERFEVPESAFERVPAGGASAPPTEATSPSAAGESWSPAMPAAAHEDWGFDEPGSSATATDELAGAGGEEAPGQKVPWWKRDIGGGKKKEAAEVAAAAGAGALAAEAASDGGGEEKPGLFKRLFGGGGAKGESAEPEAEPTPTSDVAGVGAAAESDTAVHEPAAEAPAVTEPVAAAEPIAAPDASSAPPEPADAAAADAEPATAAAPAPEVAASEPAPEPPAAETAPEPAASEPAPEPVASEPAPEPPAAEPDPEPAAPEPVTDTEPATPAADAPSDADAAGLGAAGAAGAAAAGAGDGDGEAAKPKGAKRKRSSGSRKVPKAAADAAASEDGPPEVGDQVQLKVSGGKYDAGTKGTVVDVFSAGVIVELSDDEGRTERLDLPFEAVGPADA